MDQIIEPSLRFFLVSAVQAVFLLGAAVYAVRDLRTGWWGVFGTLGGLVGGLATATYAVAWGQVEFFGDHSVLNYIYQHDPWTQLDWAMTVGIALLVVGFVLARRRPTVVNMPG